MEGADLKPLSQTARRLREISVRQLFHTVSVDTPGTDMATRIHPLLDAKHILQMVRIVRVIGCSASGSNEAFSGFFTALQSVMRHMSGLEHLSICHAYIEPSFYEEISYLQSLERLELSFCKLPFWGNRADESTFPGPAEQAHIRLAWMERRDSGENYPSIVLLHSSIHQADRALHLSPYQSAHHGRSFPKPPNLRDTRWPEFHNQVPIFQ